MHMKRYTPSPLSTCVSASSIAHCVEEVDEEEEDPLKDLELAAALPAETVGMHASEPSPEVTLDAPTRIIRTSENVRRSVPRYWDPTTPLKGESKADSEAAARRARYRDLAGKSHMRELERRKPHLLDIYSIPITGLGTPPVATDTGDLKVPTICSQMKCVLHDQGWSSELILASAASDIFRLELDRFDRVRAKIIEENPELGADEKIFMARRRDELAQKESHRQMQAMGLYEKEKPTEEDLED
jgi:hypothetical protein